MLLRLLKLTGLCEMAVSEGKVLLCGGAVVLSHHGSNSLSELGQTRLQCIEAIESVAHRQPPSE
jgi:hypothetical protein